jgi:hypothetical protein
MPEMPQDSLREAIDAIRTRLHEELEAQLARLSSRQQDELESARRAAEAAADERWSVKLDEARSEWTTRLQAEAERRLADETMRARQEAQQAAAASAAAVRGELEKALDQERERFAGERDQRQRELDTARQELERICKERDGFRQELEALRQQGNELRSELESGRRELTVARQENDNARQDADSLRQELESTRQQLEAARGQAATGTRELDAARNDLEAVRRQADLAREIEADRVAERQAQLAIVERLLTAVRAMDAGRSLTDVLSALTSAAAVEAPRVALFVVNGSELRSWKTIGFDTETVQASLNDGGLLAEVMRRREPVVSAEGDGPAAPAFASLPSDRAAIAVPLLVASQPVAVLYADDAFEGPAATPASWPEAVQILGRHASINLAHLTAARAAEAMRRAVPSSTPGGASTSEKEDGTSARRYARLLVSEIKLYNEAAVRLGRQNRDLLERLKPEIDRARKLYAQRISPAVDGRAVLFQQELVQTLADGDASLLGHPA